MAWTQNQLGGLERVSLDSYGAEASGFSMWGSLSADGRFVAFANGATDLVPGDVNGSGDIFVRDRVLGVTALEPRASDGAQGSWGAADVFR